MKYFYIVYAAKYGTIFEPLTDDEPKFYAEVLKVSTSDNIAHHLEIIGGLQFANICPTKTDAYRIKDRWNEGFKRHPDYNFSKAPLFLGW